VTNLDFEWLFCSGLDGCLVANGFVGKEEGMTLWRWVCGGDRLVVLRWRRQRKL